MAAGGGRLGLGWRLHIAGWRVSTVTNALGRGVPFVVPLLPAYTKFVSRPWMVPLICPSIGPPLSAINRHYNSVADALTLTRLDEPLPTMKPPVVLVPVARLDRATLQAVAFARSISPSVRAVHIASTAESAEAFRLRWQQWTRDVPLDVIESPYRALLQPLLRYIERVDARDDRPITIVLAEFVPRNWWEWILHSQTALRLKLALLFRPNTIVIDVPYHFADTGHTSRREKEDEAGGKS